MNKLNPIDSIKKIYKHHIIEDLKQFDTEIQKITASAYHNTYLLSNHVLSRNPFNNSLLHNLHFRVPAQRVDVIEVVWKLLLFYLKSIFYLTNHAATWIVARVCFRPSFKRVSEPVVIDNFLLVESTLANQSYEEKYFPGLYEVFSHQGRDVYLFPCIYGRVALWNKGVKLFKIIRRAPINIITEYDLLEPVDYFRLAQFVLLYPFSVIRLALQTAPSGYFGKLLSAELLKTLDQVTAPSYIRYLAGMRLAGCFAGNITVISWFENQTQQKNFYRGLRNSAVSSTIYACRSYIDFPAYVSSSVAESEIPCGVVPDKVLVNGTAYMKQSDRLEYRLGVSFRYDYLFNQAIPFNEDRSQCVIFLSYFYERNIDFVRLCSASCLANQIIKVRLHPADTRSSQLELPVGWSYDKSDKISALGSAAIVITSESGIAVEAAALGISIIVVASQSSFICNPMFDCGYGVIWDLVFDATELNCAYERLMGQRRTNINGIHEAAKWYKDSCFVEPTADNINRAFDLCR